MKYHLSKSTGYSLATLEQSESKTVIAYISADLHQEQTIKHKATELLYTQMLLSGAGTYTREQFLDALNALGATISVSINDSILTISLRSSAATYKKVLVLLKVMLLSPTFNAKELARVKLIVTNEIKESKEESKAIAREELRNTFYGAHDRRYSHNEDDLIEHITKINKADLSKLHTRFVTTNWTCTQGSNKELCTQFANVVKNCNRAKETQEPLQIHQQTPPRPGLTLRNIPSRQNIDFSIGAPLPITMHHPDYAPLLFGITVLGKLGGFTGRLMSTVREVEGLTYGIYASTETFFREEQGYWRIMTFFSPEKAVQGLTSTFREVQKLYDDGITNDELVKFKKILHTGQALKNDSTSSLLGELHAYHMQNFSLKEIEEYKQRILLVTQKEVNEAIRTYLNPNTLTISGAGPIATVKKELQSFIKTVA
jgi:zinc protease